MTVLGWVQIALYCAFVVALTKPLGGYLTRVFAGERTLPSVILRPIEAALYRVAGVDPRVDQHWRTYAVAMLVFNAAGFLLLHALQRLQGALPLNPQAFAGVTPDLAFNTAVSFVTNTNWQSYGGESTMSYLTQMLGLTVQNFLSSATGIALALALVRGFARKSAQDVGNFWVDLTRSILYVLLPVCFVLALFFVWQGVPQNLAAYVEATTLRGRQADDRAGARRLAACHQDAGDQRRRLLQRQLSAPVREPDCARQPGADAVDLRHRRGADHVFGRMVGDERQGWAILAAMGVLFLAGVAVAYWAEAHANPAIAALGVDPAGGNMEGKEVRFGVPLSALFAVVTTAASCGAVIAMHDSFLPLGGMVPLVNILLGEIIVGGVGAGLYGILLFAILAVFVAGLMVGRTPEYVGKKIEAKEVKMTMLAILCLPLSILGFTAMASVISAGLAGVLNPGPHGFSEMLYAYTSGTGNNGSAFAGLTANSVFYNLTLGFAMLIGRFAMIVPMLAVAGSLAAKTTTPASAGTFPTHGGLFVGLLVGVILIMGGLTFFPALSLGPIIEHLAMQSGTLF